ncbi:hypothetical protein Ciccas_007498 [Cichlidogyrus casuarinus]|uniref:Uncharacterized protein n=1 Tax=Cichlidogyrus casuarinus TaxID=1844966 RepID=A0ABD2Q2P8_9PLAT
MNCFVKIRNIIQNNGPAIDLNELLETYFRIFLPNDPILFELLYAPMNMENYRKRFSYTCLLLFNMLKIAAEGQTVSLLSHFAFYADFLSLLLLAATRLRVAPDCDPVQRNLIVHSRLLLEHLTSIPLPTRVPIEILVACCGFSAIAHDVDTYEESTNPEIPVKQQVRTCSFSAVRTAKHLLHQIRTESGPVYDDLLVAFSRCTNNWISTATRTLDKNEQISAQFPDLRETTRIIPFIRQENIGVNMMLRGYTHLIALIPFPGPEEDIDDSEIVPASAKATALMLQASLNILTFLDQSFRFLWPLHCGNVRLFSSMTSEFSASILQQHKDFAMKLEKIIKAKNRKPLGSLEENISEYFVAPFVGRLPFNEGLVLKIVDYVVNKSPDALQQDPITQSDLLDVTFLDNKILNLLRTNGVRDPQKLLYQCPSMILGCLPSSDGSSIAQNAVRFLRQQLSKKDLVSLLRNNSIVLTYDIEYLEQLYDFIVQDLKLEPRSEVALIRQHPKEMRHRLPIRIATTIAWRIPLARLKARYSLAKMLNLWPPRDISLANGESSEVYFTFD